LSGALGIAASAQTAPATFYTLGGKVTNHLTGEPIPLATVRLTKEGMPPFSLATVADSSGHFQFTGLLTGNYLLSGDRPEFMPGQPVAVNARPDSTNIRLQLSPLGVIAGTVFAEDGDPLSGVTLVALRLTENRGKILLSQVAKTSTDDLGSYRLHGLPPGRYYVKVNLHAHSADATSHSQEPGGRAIFYPHGVNQDQATLLDIAAGSALTDISFTLPGGNLAVISDAQNLPAADSAAIQGQVLNTATGDPIAKAQVALLGGNETSRETINTRSDAAGNFNFKGIAPGTYRIAATRTGFLANALATGSSDSDRALTVAASQTLHDVALRLMPQGVVAGKILEGNVPISNAIVMATRSYFIAGERKLALVSRTYTNDLGAYRLFGLPPGRYYVSVTYRGGTAPGSPQFADLNVAQNVPAKEDYVNTFYPEALTLGDAVPLEVTPGSVQTGIDVALFRMRKLSASGTVLPLPGIHFTGPLTVVLLPRDSSLLMKFSQQSASVDMRTGAFEIHGVTPGSYTLAVDAQAGGDRYTASVLVDVTKADVDGLTVMLTRSFPIRGRVTAEGSDQCDFSGLNANAQSYGQQGMGRSASAPVHDDGSFTLDNLRPDHYHLRLTGVAGNCYLKSISLGSRDVTATDALLTQGSPPIGFTLSAAGGKIEGDVIDEQHDPVKSATVVLIPQPPLREQRDLYRNTSTDQSGKFNLQGITPGDYKLFAWDAIGPDSYLDPDVLALFEDLGWSVSVQEAGQSKIELTVIANGGRLTP
jgi:hypothetical protein